MTAGDSGGDCTRFEIEATLGEGGMGAVFRARDRVAERTVALKRLQVSRENRRAVLTSLFEREYHTLSQLSHPSVIKVFDYGVDDDGPFYTMELLEGEDLNRAHDLSEEEICGVLHDVASCLSLLHARRLVHRDVSSRNIRIVERGRAKLLDFGALAPMGRCEHVVGTPMFVAPEAVLVQPLDGRADLYSVGVALYRALTGRYPYRAKTIGRLRHAWRNAPLPPHEVSPSVSRELSQLAMSLIALDRDARPRDATEVMEKLAAIGALDRAEPPGASRAYLVTPTLVGRTEVMRRVRGRLLRAMRRHGSGLVFTGQHGVGRSRMLDATVLQSKLLGTNVLHVDERQARSGPFAAMRSLSRQLLAIEPGLIAEITRRDPSKLSLVLQDARRPDSPVDDQPATASSPAPPDSAAHRLRVIDAFRSLIRETSRHTPTTIVADDVHMLDEPSVAALATLLQDVASTGLVIVASIPQTAVAEAELSQRLLLQRSDLVELSPLSPKATRKLMRSTFGAVPHVDSLAARLHTLGRGYPRDMLALAEHLVETGVIEYRAGAFSLPATLSANALPDSLSAALRRRTQGLSPLALTFAQTRAIAAVRTMTRSEFRDLSPDASIAQVQEALDELVAADVFSVDGASYGLRHEGWLSALADRMGPEERIAHHRTLAHLPALTRGEPLTAAYHAMHAREQGRALALVAEYASKNGSDGVDPLWQTRLPTANLGWLLSTCFQALSEQRQTSAETLTAIRHLVMALGVYTNARWFNETAPKVEAFLKRDSGFVQWQSLDPAMEPMARLTEALQKAQAAYDAAPEDHHLAPGDAIRHLVQYCVAAIAVGARSLDGPLRRRLPGLLEPFTPLSPLIAAMKENCLSAAESTLADYESAFRRLLPVVETLSSTENVTLRHADEILAACRYAVGVYQARLGLPEAETWLKQVEHHPHQASNVLRTRAQLALMRGDWARAHDYHEAAEQYDMEHGAKQMFGRATLASHLEYYARGHDLANLRRLIDVMAPLADDAEGWRPYVVYATAECERLRGDYQAAIAQFDRCVSLCTPEHRLQHPEGPWYLAQTGALEIMAELGELQGCSERAKHALSLGGEHAPGARYDGIKRALSLCEAKQGHIERALARLQALIDNRKRLGTRGLHLGLLYEALALVQLWGDDLDGATESYERTREELLACPASGYTARVEGLRQQLQQRGTALRSLEGLEPAAYSPKALPPEREAMLVVSRVLDHCDTSVARANQGLRLLCRRSGAADGYLYLLEDGEADAAPVPIASTARNAPPAGLTRFLRKQLKARLSDQTTEFDALTATTLEESDEMTADVVVWVPRPEEGTRRYHIVWLSTALAGEGSIIGLAALGYDEPTQLPTTVTTLASAFGNYLARTTHETET
ncbi:MAG: serine/threonine-protein kinase [Myxococcales bacterium]|nr:serine/threonine-protein kinase [Myxococcales bacterium]